MVQTIPVSNVDLRYLRDRFGLQLVEDERFFREWQDNLLEISDSDKQLLNQVKAGYLNLIHYPPLLEDAVRMAVLDPILFIGGFYLAPFYVRLEESIELAIEDEDVLVKGRIDTLVLKERLWVMVVESKKTSFSIEAGLAQILAYMLGNPNSQKPSYGMITTGGSFIFLKLVQANSPQYGTSKLFATRNPGDLYSVLSIFKRLSQLVTD